MSERDGGTGGCWNARWERGSVVATGEWCDFSHYLRSSRWTPGRFSSVSGSTRASSAVFLSLACVGRGKLTRMVSRFSTNCPSCFMNFALWKEGEREGVRGERGRKEGGREGGEREMGKLTANDTVSDKGINKFRDLTCKEKLSKSWEQAVILPSV